MGYKNNTYYDFMNTLEYREGVFYDKGRPYSSLKEELDKAYKDGLNGKGDKKDWLGGVIDISVTIFWIILLLAVYTLFLFVLKMIVE